MSEQSLGTNQGQGNSLFASNIPPTITEADLYTVFSPPDGSNPIQSLRIIRDPATGAARYAYINFTTPEAALNVFETMNYKAYNGYTITLARNIKPHLLPPNANLYISGFTQKPSDQDLYNAFSPFGSIASARSFGAPNARIYAYVQFETAQSANAALNEVKNNGLNLPSGNEKVSIDIFQPRGTRQNPFTNVFVRNFPTNFTVDQFKVLASKYGTVTSVHMPTSFPSKPGSTGPSETGFAFANYSTPEEAQAAIVGFCQEVIAGYPLQAFKALDRQARQRQIAAAAGSYTHRPNNRSNNRLAKAIRFTHLPPELTQKDLIEKLEQYGGIEAFSRRQHGATVHFTTTEAASAAYAALSKVYTCHFTYSPPYPSRRFPHRPYHHPRHQMRPHFNRPPRSSYAPYPYPPHQYYGYPPHGYPMQPPPPQRYSTRRGRQQQAQQQQAQQQLAQPVDPTVLGEEERQSLGSAIYFQIKERQHDDDMASKITGMLLELAPHEVRTLAQSPQALDQKIKEAIDVLQTQ